MQKILRRRKQLAIFLLYTFISGTFLPQSVATAQALFSRPGAGVSRLPLNVLAFNAPEFGTVRDAINLANGNVFVSMSDLSRNNVVEAGKDETVNSVGGTLWQLSSRLRLEGFRREMVVTELPASFFLGNGDGSGNTFKRVEKNTLTFSELPTWIARYETTTNAYLYTLQAQQGLQYSQEWVVLLPSTTVAANNGVAHYYTADGTRHTFYSDGEYLDYIQDIYQQYRSASSFDSEGRSGTAPKTQVSYNPQLSGRISRVQDEYGRVTTYTWTLPAPVYDNDPTTLDRIVYLVVPVAGGTQPSTFARVTEFFYETTTIGAVSIQRIKSVKFSAKDGFGSTAARGYEFSYYNDTNFIQTIKRKSNDTRTVPDLTTTYTYDTTHPNRIKEVSRNDGSPSTIYTYSDIENNGVVQGFKVDVSQDPDPNISNDQKQTIFSYNAAGQLLEMKAYDSQLDGVGGYLTTSYTYYPTGSTKSVTYPSGMTEVYSYDGKGNLTEIRTFGSSPYTIASTNPISVTLGSPPAAIQSGKPFQFTANIVNDVVGAGFYWQSLKPGTTDEPLGYITQQGVFLPPDQNTTVTIKATSIADPSKSAQVDVVVKNVVLTLRAPKTSIVVNDKLQLTATLKDDLTYRITPFNAGVTWSTTAGTIDINGLFTAPPDVTAAVITATSKSDLRKSKSVTVTTYPPRIVLSPTLFDSRGSYTFVAEGDPAGFTWNSYAPGLVDGTTGQFTATPTNSESAGYVRARSKTNPSLYVYQDVLVRGNEIRIINLPSASISSGSQHQFGLDVRGTNTPVSWQILSGGGSISSTGLYTAPIVATDTGIWLRAYAGPSQSTVYPYDYVFFTVKGDAIRIKDFPNSALSSGTQHQFRVDVKGTNTPVSWQILSGGGSISPTGLYAAPLVSTDTQIWLRAYAGPSQSTVYPFDNIYFTVKGDSIRITDLPQAAISSNSQHQFAVTVKGSSTPVSWQVLSGGGSISSAGLYTAPKVSTDTQIWLRAYAGPSQSTAYPFDNVYFTVKADAVRITNLPNAAISSGSTHAFGVDAQGSSVSWQVMSGGGSISSTGVYTAPMVSSDTQIWLRAYAGPSQSTVYPYDNIYFTVKGDSVKIINLPSAGLSSGSQRAFEVDVKGNRAVSWQVMSGGGSINASGVYTAPMVSTDTQVWIRAYAGPSQTTAYPFDNIYFTVKADAIRIKNMPAALLNGGTQHQFSADVKGGRAVSWQVISGGGSISSTGLYTAPNVTVDTQAVLRAYAGPSQSTAYPYDNVYFTIKGSSNSLTITAQDFTGILSSGASQQFAVENQTVTWTASSGQITSEGLYTAPILNCSNDSSITNNTNCNTSVFVKATSTATPSLSTTYWFTVKDDGVEITNAPEAAVSANATFDFDALINDPLGVTWSIKGPLSSQPEGYYGTITADGVYTAPVLNCANDSSITNNSNCNTNVYVTATSITNPSVVDTIWFSVKDDAIEITTAPTTGISAKSQFDFDATVRDPAGVTWSVQPPQAGQAPDSYGTITPDGIYTAPILNCSNDSSLTNNSNCNTLSYVTATSKSNPAVIDTIWFSIKDDAVEIINAPTAALSASVPFKFEANVKDPEGITWSIQPVPQGQNADHHGTIAADGTYTAPILNCANDSSITNNSNCNTTLYVKATSNSNPNVHDTIWFSVKDDAVEITNGPVAAISANTTFDFDALVRDTAGITWRVQAPPTGQPNSFYGTINSEGVYTAPVLNCASDTSITNNSNCNTLIYITATSNTNPNVYDTIWFSIKDDAIEIDNAPTVTLDTKGQFDFSAVVKDPAGVVWSVRPGTTTTPDLFGTIDANGLYTAPNTATDTDPYIVATSASNPTVYDTIWLTARAIRTRIKDAPTIIDAGGTYQLTSEVTYDALNQGVNWTLSPVAPSTSTDLGTVSEAGVYTAPFVDTDTQITLTATSKTNPLKSSSLKFTVRAIKVVLQKIPNNQLVSGQSHKLNATAIFDVKKLGFTYTSSLGPNTIKTDGTFVAPHVTTDTTVTLTATSKANPTKSDSVTVTIKPPQDQIVPADQGNPTVFVESIPNPSSILNDYVRRQTFVYDRDNRLIVDSSAGVKGTGYTYQNVSQQHTIEPYGTVTVNGQRFTAPRKITHQTVLGGQVTPQGMSGGQLLDDTTYTFEKYDTRGLIIESVRRSKSQVQTTQYSYFPDGSSATVPWATKATGAAGLTRTVKQYADLVQSVNVVNLGATNYTYDELGNVVKEEQPNAFVRDWQKVDATTFNRFERSRVTYSSFNGYGQQVWERIQEEGANLNPVTVSLRVTEFYATGEPIKSWEGRSTNVTTYAYIKDAGTLGLGQVQKIGQLHSSQTFTYDKLGRVQTTMLDNVPDYKTTYSYDSLDRVIREVMPAQAGAQGEVRTSYDHSGVVNSTTVIDPLATHGSTNISTTALSDSLGRITRVTYPGDYTVDTLYDPFDRPLKITDNRLTINAAGDDRASFFVYDSLGNRTKELGPVLRSTDVSTGYKDLRRPYTEYSYDLLSRPIETKRLLSSSTPVSTTNPVMPTDGTVSVSKTAYDAFDRATTLTDGAGYTTTLAYDTSGNVVKSFKQVWKGNEDSYSTLRTYGDTVTMYMAYDATGRVTAQVDGRGNSKATRYDLLGRPLAQKDERDIVTHLYGYTSDGLLLCVAEPDPAGTSAVNNLDMTIPASATTCTSAPNGYVLTKLYTYGTRQYPTDLYVASKTAGASTSSPRTSYSYDYAGRTLTTTLPALPNDAATITQSYDTRGNLLSLKDANGFTTTYTYDAYNRVTQEKKLARTDGSSDGVSDVDAAAGLTNGLTTAYSYDAAGNLSTQTVGEPNGLTTDYFYNSFGKVIAESRPYLASAGIRPVKLRVYQLDGNLTAETSYDYQGNLRDAQNPNPGPYASQVPTVTQGNVTTYSYDARALLSLQASNGPSGNEFFSYYFYNGLGQKVKRSFTGWGAIYATARENNGKLASAPDYNSYWKYDQNGNLLESYDTLPSGSSKQNIYSYTYTPTNKEDVQSRDVKIAVQAPRGQDSSSPFAPNRATSGVYVGYSGGSVDSNYDARDLLSQSVVSEANAANFFGSGDTTVTTTTYTYGKDASKARIDISENGVTSYKTFEYDARGRETSVADGNALSSFVVEQNAYNTNAGSLSNTVTTYESGGKVTQRTTSTQFGDCTSYSIPTVGGLTQSSAVCTRRIEGTGNITNYTYNQLGTLTASAGLGNLGYVYNEYNQLTRVYPTSGSNSADAYSATYNLNGDITSEPKDGVTYTLDSRGNRLEVSGGQFNGHTKRYDADGRVREFHQYTEINRWIFGTKPITRYIFFSYDPYGNQVISVKAQLEENTADSRHHVIDRQQSTSISSGGNVQVIRYQDVFYGTYCTLGVCLGGNEKENVIRDESFSLIDSYYQDNLYKTTGPIVAPFDLIAETNQPLEAPVESLSTTLQIDPMDIVAPNEAAPPTTPGESVEEITPPSDAEAATQPDEEQATDDQTATNTTGITTLMEGGTIGAVETTPTNPVNPETTPLGGELANTPTEGAIPGLPETLTSPTGALPESLGSVNTEDIILPETPATTVFTAPTAPAVAETTPDEVVSPDANIAPPNVGATPQDGPLDVVMPEELTASVPSVGGDVPAPIETVIPPVGWSPDDTGVDTFGDPPTYTCGWMLDANYNDCRDKYDDELADYWESEGIKIENEVGSDATEENAQAEKERVTNSIAAALPVHGGELVTVQVNDIYAALDGFTPYEKIVVLRSLEQQVKAGNYAGGYEDANSLTPLDEAWKAAVGEGDFYTSNPDERKLMVADTVNADLALFATGSRETKFELLHFYAYRNPDYWSFLMGVNYDGNQLTYQDASSGTVLGLNADLAFNAGALVFAKTTKGAMGDIAFVMSLRQFKQGALAIETVTPDGLGFNITWKQGGFGQAFGVMGLSLGFVTNTMDLNDDLQAIALSDLKGWEQGFGVALETTEYFVDGIVGNVGLPAACTYVTAGALAYGCAAVLPTGFDIATDNYNEGIKYLFGLDY